MPKPLCPLVLDYLAIFGQSNAISDLRPCGETHTYSSLGRCELNPHGRRSLVVVAVRTSLPTHTNNETTTVQITMPAPRNRGYR